MPRRFFASCLLASIGLTAATAAPASAAGGTVSGTVKLAATPPKPATIKVTKDAASCGADYASETVKVDATGGLANVVVTLKAVKAAAPATAPAVPATAPAAPAAPATKATLDQVGCRYQPHVQAVRAGTELTLINSDRVLHNVHGNQGPITVFNMAMPIKGQRLPTKLTRPGLVRLQCDAGHTWMNAWIFVADHPYYAVTDAGGRFQIGDVPPGDYALELWHEPVDGKGAGTTQTSRLTVNSGPTPTSVDVTFKL
jgi:plastocyanin